MEAARPVGLPTSEFVVEPQTSGPRSRIEDAGWLAWRFFHEDLSVVGPNSFDKWTTESPTDRIVTEDIRIINASMAARSPYKRWKTLQPSGPLAELARLDPAWDLVLLEDREWAAHDVARLTSTLIDATLRPGLGRSVVTKVLYLKRPRLIPIFDSLVVAQLGGSDTSTTVDLLEHFRKVCRNNLAALEQIRSFLSDHGKERTYVRIADAILWASHRDSYLARRLEGWEVVVRPALAHPSRPLDHGGRAGQTR